MISNWAVDVVGTVKVFDFESSAIEYCTYLVRQGVARSKIKMWRM